MLVPCYSTFDCLRDQATLFVCFCHTNSYNISLLFTCVMSSEIMQVGWLKSSDVKKMKYYVHCTPTGHWPKYALFGW